MIQLISSLQDITEAISRVRNSPSKEFCSLCSEADCDHDEPKLSKTEILNLLNYWLGVARSYAGDDIITISDERRDVYIYRFPSNGQRENGIAYDTYPRLDQPLSFLYVKDGITRGFTCEEECVEFNPNANIVSDGVYWGYWVDGVFYLIKGFSRGKFFTPRQPQLGKAQDLSDNVVGFWHVPSNRMDYINFANSIYTT